MMMFHEDELIPLNTPYNLPIISLYIVISHTGDIRSSGRVADAPVIVMIRFYFDLSIPLHSDVFHFDNFRPNTLTTTELDLYPAFRIHERKLGIFHGGWIYFILTWLISHRKLFVQEAACLIMVRLRLVESKHDAKGCQQELLGHVTQTWVQGDVILHPDFTPLSPSTEAAAFRRTRLHVRQWPRWR